MLTRWSDMGMGELSRSLAALGNLSQEMDRLFQNFEGDWSWGLPLLSGAAMSSGWPRMQIADTGDALRVVAEVPGMKPEDLQISLEGDALTIRGERRADVPEGYQARRKERSAMRFARTLALPASVEADDVTAKLSNGMLELTLPKSADARPRSIAVKAA